MATTEENPVLTPRQIITAMSGLVVAMLLAQLDNMIVAPALPTIVGDLGGLNHLSWVVTGYILASAVATPIWGKLGDLFGHKYTFMSAIVLFLLGSALCGLAQNMGQLVFFRAFQGLGAGGLIVGIMSVLGILVPPRDRGKYMGIMMAVMPVAMIGGPLVGGFITDHVSWRWNFYVNLPLGGIALFVIWSTLHLTHEARRTEKVVIDWWGISVLTTWIVSLVLAITWGGTEYPWGSWQINTLFAVAAVGLVVFVLIERKAVEPVIGLHLFGSKNFTLATVIGFVAGFGMFGTITFLPQFQQFVQGQSATNSGLLLMPMMLALMATSIGGGQYISRTGRYKAFPVVGTVLLGIGLYLFSTMTVDTGTGRSALFMIVMGLGLGCLMQTTNLVAQNSVELRDLGAGTGTFTFVRTLGGSIGVAILGTIYTHHLTQSLTESVGKTPDLGGGSVASLTPAALKDAPADFIAAFRHAVVAGTHQIFLWAAVLTIVAFLISWFIKEVPLRGSAPVVADAGSEVDDLV
ncbi:DHA2 family efflux MFS transporter permease subunit [Nocardioides marmoriginsengisoli]|uniref:DHA2 family efflux MFS transporter permease subunit n=1 Tax=Nocardioides marmoriginsengisoli TaxID=661483 RepID=A0A3N0CIU7_9ACTN|nr:MDR family MFS transporter [Nocardioides marmoriginsengisoli]RNL62936.1 DHA2 family efflux MFS transporter permease subunit [Nocardioides marmoriginsengisoli]